MLDIGVGLSTKKDPIQAAKEATVSASLNLHHRKIDLAIVFSSVDLASVSLLETIDLYLKEKVPIIGSSTAAIISGQGIFKHGLVVMLLSLPEGVYFNTACVKEIKKKTALNAGRELAEGLLYGFRDIRRDICIIFCDGLIEEGSSLIYGLQEKLGRSFPLVGASASDDLHFLKTYLYFNQELLSDSAIGILFGGGKLNFGLGIKHGWKPIGKPRTVTKSCGNIIYEIDGQPAAKIYQDYLAYDLYKLKKELKHISMLYPIGVYLNKDEYLLRNILSIEEGDALRSQGNVTEGSPIRLMIGTRESLFVATYEALNEAKKVLGGPSMEFKKKGMNNFVFIFDSVSRYMLLRRNVTKELEIIKEGFNKNTPIIGLYTYAETAPLRTISSLGQAYFHNQTIALLSVGG